MNAESSTPGPANGRFCAERTSQIVMGSESRSRAIMVQQKAGKPVPIVLGHTKIENTVRYLGVDVEDALTLVEKIET